MDEVWIEDARYPRVWADEDGIPAGAGYTGPHPVIGAHKPEEDHAATIARLRHERNEAQADCQRAEARVVRLLHRDPDPVTELLDAAANEKSIDHLIDAVRLLAKR